MKEFLHYLKEHYHYAERTVTEKENHILLWKSICSRKQNFDTVTTQELLNIIELLQKKYSLNTINNHIKTVEQYFDYLQLKGKRKDHPLKNFRIKTPKRPLITGFLTEDELHEIYTRFTNRKYQIQKFDIYGKRDKIILGLIIYQALSSGCLRELELKDIDLEKGLIRVPKATENRFNERTLSLEASQILDIYHYIKQTRPQLVKLLKTNTETEKLFVTDRNTKFSNITTEIRKKIEIQNLQQIRNSRINLWLKQYNLREVQYKAG
ncbi:tyrosine-type recombinase/integrase, partial [Chryseobacterium oryctis]